MIKRTNKTIQASPDEQILWKKIGGGSLRFNRKIIKSGQTFKATVKDIPEGFRDVVVPVDGLSVQSPKEAKGIIPVFTKKAREDDETLFDVVNQKGKVLNQVGLSSEKADKFIQNMSE